MTLLVMLLFLKYYFLQQLTIKNSQVVNHTGTGASLAILMQKKQLANGHLE